MHSNGRVPGDTGSSGARDGTRPAASGNDLNDTWRPVQGPDLSAARLIAELTGEPLDEVVRLLDPADRAVAGAGFESSIRLGVVRGGGVPGDLD